MSTTHVSADAAPERCLVYDASQHRLGRLAAQIAMNLMGKDIPQYTPNSLNGALVVVINAEKVQTTGKKTEQKGYAHYTGYPSGHKVVPYARRMKEQPTHIVKLAVKRMLPKTTLGRDMLRRLKIYAGAEHPHAAQKPVKVDTIRS